jgi:hypothetical protein
VAFLASQEAAFITARPAPSLLAGVVRVAQRSSGARASLLLRFGLLLLHERDIDPR